MEKQRRGSEGRLLFASEGRRISHLVNTNSARLGDYRRQGISFMIGDMITSQQFVDLIFQAVEEARTGENGAVFDKLQREYPVLNYRRTNFDGTIEESFGNKDGKYFSISYGENFDGRVILERQYEPRGAK